MIIWNTDLDHYHARRMARLARLSWLAGTAVGLLLAGAVMLAW